MRGVAGPRRVIVVAGSLPRRGEHRGVAAESVILVTGCSSGIGRATVLEAAARGHRVFATARNRADLVDLERRERVESPVDVTEAGSIREAMDAAVSRAGRLDALVNNAGYGQYGAVEDVTPDEWRAQFEVNLFGAIAVPRRPCRPCAGRGAARS